MKQVKVLAALGLLGLASAANADVSSSISIVSDYDFRGFTQTANKPALQGSLDYSHSSGWYVGTWASNIDFGTPVPHTETDLYTGFKGTAGDLGWDAGVIYYGYNGNSDLGFAEIYGKFSYNIASVGLFYSNDFGGKATGTSSDSAFYVSGDLAIPAGPLSIGVHAGYSSGDGVKYALLGGGADSSYVDYGLGLSYSSDNFTFGIKWVAKDLGSTLGSDDRILLTLSTALPFPKK
jgi:uncharacterized protein (TIGR02001 family)